MSEPTAPPTGTSDAQADVAAARPPHAISRRRLLTWGGSTAAVGAVGAAGAAASGTGLVRLPAGGAGAAPAAPVTAQLPERVEFHGIHQAGIATPAQGHLLLTAYDVAPDVDRAGLAGVLRAWTAAARDLTAGRAVTGDPMIAEERAPAALTVTVGIGGALLDRLGLPRPDALADLPAFAGDELDDARGGGDLVVQLCADDPLVLASADRVLRRAAGAAVRLRWQETGFQGAKARAEGRTTRNLMGQVDGSNNVTTSERATGGPVWVEAADSGDAHWVAGGSYLVVRRIRMLMDPWEALPLRRQEEVIGRHKASGAPLGSARESDPVDLEARHPDGDPVIPTNSHVRLTTPREGEQMLRRGYSYRAGVLPDGTTDQGLLFMCYVKDPRTSFVPVQQRMADHDALNPFTRTTASAVFAALPGVEDEQDWYGRALLT